MDSFLSPKEVTDLIDEGHRIHQQLRVHSILLIQNLHGIRPQLAACVSNSQ